MMISGRVMCKGAIKAETNMQVIEKTADIQARSYIAQHSAQIAAAWHRINCIY